MAHPSVLASLVERYETLTAQRTADADPETRRRIDDVVYTLCVSTHTRDIASALRVARRQLAAPADLDRSAAVAG